MNDGSKGVEVETDVDVRPQPFEERRPGDHLRGAPGKERHVPAADRLRLLLRHAPDPHERDGRVVEDAPSCRRVAARRAFVLVAQVRLGIEHEGAESRIAVGEGRHAPGAERVLATQQADQLVLCRVPGHRLGDAFDHRPGSPGVGLELGRRVDAHGRRLAFELGVVVLHLA